MQMFPKLPRFLLVFLIGSFCLAGTFRLATAKQTMEPIDAKHAKVRLVSEAASVEPSDTFYVGMEFELEKHWHVYWKNPGASGLPVELEWTLPEGLEAGEIVWPPPERIKFGDMYVYGYEDSVLLMVPMTWSDAKPTPETLTIKAEAFWLICKEVCLPDEATLKIEVPVSEKTAINKETSHLFENAREQRPSPFREAPWQLNALKKADALEFRFDGGKPPPPDRQIYFFAEQESLIDANASQTFAQTAPESWKLRAPIPAAYPKNTPDRIKGLLQVGDAFWSVNTPLQTSRKNQETAVSSETTSAAADSTSGQEEKSETNKTVGASSIGNANGLESGLFDLGWPGWLALAFLGGLILNVMPCVLPVLSLKVFSLLQHRGEPHSAALKHGLVYTAGVVLSFLLLGVLLLALRSMGQQIGWGFQLQNPAFLTILVLVFFLFGLNLLGVFEIGTRLVGADAQVANRNDLLGSFGMGILATVVGAPCIGPFMASVGGLVVQVEASLALTICGFMGLGLAFPFLLVAFFPKCLAFLPKPGAWMESVKHVFGFMLLAAVLFLLYVAGTSGGVDALMNMHLLLWIGALTAWIYGRWSVPHRSIPVRRLAAWSSLALLVVATAWTIKENQMAYAQSTEPPMPSRADAAQNEDQLKPWADWSRERVEQLLQQGTPVFVDFTASWCLICQVNKKRALRTDATRELFETYGIQSLVADWTRNDPRITREIERFERAGVPLYVLYLPNGEHHILPQNLSNETIRNAVEQTLGK